MIKNRLNHRFFSKRNILYIVILLSVGITLFLFYKIEPVQQREVFAPYRYQEIIEEVRAENLSNTVSRLQPHKNRSTWEEQWKATHWVSDEFKRIGVDACIHQYELRGRIWPNVIARIKGEERPDEIILLSVHIDSICDNGENIAQGADDNASGVAVMLETARILKKISMNRTVIFSIFSNEERGTAGSRAYARLAKKEGYNIKHVINLDILGYNLLQRPFYWDAIAGHDALRHKLKAMFRMVRNYTFGLINGKDVVAVAGREPNRQLAVNTSLVLKKTVGLKIKEKIQDDCG